MPTFHNPLADAAEASEALRGLAHASRAFDNPGDTYTVFGELVAGVRSLRQVLDQLAESHLTHRDRARRDDGDPLAGAQVAVAAADELHQAATLLDQAYDRLDAAFSHSGRIAWHPQTAAVSQSGPIDDTASRRWLGVVFLQGEGADEVLDLIDREGTSAAIEHLQGFDYGAETTDAALENGYVYDEPPAGMLDRTAAEGEYTLTYNSAMGHVSLLRSYLVPPDPALDEVAPMAAREAITGVDPLTPGPPSGQETAPPRARLAVVEDWFAGRAHPSGSAGRGLSR